MAAVYYTTKLLFTLTEKENRPSEVRYIYTCDSADLEAKKLEAETYVRGVAKKENNWTDIIETIITHTPLTLTDYNKAMSGANPNLLEHLQPPEEETPINEPPAE